MAAADDTYLDEAYDEGIDHAHAGEIVQWYAKRPVTVSTAAATSSLVGAFALGVLTTIGALAVLRHRVRLAPELDIEGLSVDQVLQQLLDQVPAPRL